MGGIPGMKGGLGMPGGIMGGGPGGPRGYLRHQSKYSHSSSYLLLSSQYHLSSSSSSLSSSRRLHISSRSWCEPGYLQATLTLNLIKHSIMLTKKKEKNKQNPKVIKIKGCPVRNTSLQSSTKEKTTILPKKERGTWYISCNIENSLLTFEKIYII